MKSLRTRAESVLGWKQAYDEVTSKPLDAVLTYYKAEHLGAKKILDTVFVGGELVKALGKTMVIGLVQIYSERKFIAQAEREGYPTAGVSANGLAKKVVNGFSNSEVVFDANPVEPVQQPPKTVGPVFSERVLRYIKLGVPNITTAGPVSDEIKAERLELPPDSPL